MRRIALLVPALLLAAGTAEAHTGVASTAGFAHGFTHPLFGLDHLLAMVAVGAWAAMKGGRATWLVPLSFVAVMAIGGVLGMTGLPLPGVEFGILGSLVVLGVLIATGTRLPIVAATAVVGLFALFHGHAHGSEMPIAASGLAYGAGFLLATAGLHGIGIGAGLMARRSSGEVALRTGGAAIAAAGALLMVIG